MSDKLISAIRHYKHNDDSSGFVVAYDQQTTDKVIAELEKRLNDYAINNPRSTYPEIKAAVEAKYYNSKEEE